MGWSTHPVSEEQRPVLEVENRFMIKEMYRKGISISEIARQTGRDRKTVRKAIQGELIPVRKPASESRERKLDPYTDYLQGRMKEGVYNARKLYREIKERGYSGGVTQVILYLQPFRPARTEQATLRFETEPGQQAQVDWGSFGYINAEGRQKILYCFVMTLGWSRMMYVEFTTQSDTGSFIRCHQHAFTYFGGVPREMLHDNLKSAVIRREADGTVHFNERYLDFALAMGFVPHPHRPYRPQTKGKVESGVRYVEGNFWTGLHFTDIDDINAQAQVWLNTVANPRFHGTTGERPFDRLPHEHLQPLPARWCDTSIVSYRRAGRDCLVRYQGNSYSVPVAAVGQMLLVKETEDQRLLFFDAAGVLVAEHRLLRGQHQWSKNPAHYAGLPAPVSHPPCQHLAFQTSDRSETSAAWETIPEVEQRPLSAYAQLLEECHD
jgi:transposase